MDSNLDMRTVFLVCSALNVVLGLCMVMVQRSRQTYPGFTYWTIACLGLAFALTMFALPRLFPAPLITIGGNFLFILYPMLFGRGFRAFAGRPYNYYPAAIAIVLGSFVAYYYTSIDRNMVMRVTGLSLIILPFYLDCAWFVWRDPSMRYGVARTWLACSFVILAIWSSLRLVLMHWLEPDKLEIWTPSLIQAVTMIIISAQNITGIFGVFLLNFQRAAGDLRERERRLSLAMSATQDAIWEWDVQTNQTYYSPRWFEMLGLPDQSHNMTMETWRSLCHPDDVEPTLAKVASATKSSVIDSYSAEFRMRHADGTWRWIQGRGRVVGRDAQGQSRLMSGTNTDITPAVQARERQAKLELQLQQAQKMEALGTLAGGIAHDFNNILVGIQGNVQLAEMQLPENSETRKLLENARKAGRRARDLVARLMAFSRKSPPARQSVAVGPLIEEVVALVRATLPGHIVLERKIAPGCPPLDGDAAEIHEVLMNLVVNAGAALGEKSGVIEISLQFGPPAAELRELNPLVRPEPQLQLTVRDNGSGMTPEVRARIFEPFFTTKGQGVGSGIGLTMVHRIVTELGGTIVVDTAPGRGTRMILLLPAGQSALPPATGTASPFPSPARAKGRILLVDDELEVLTVAALALEQVGLSPETHASANAALAAFQAEPGAYVALLTDLSMPEMSGVQLSAKIRQLSPQLPVVIMSGNLTETARAAARALGQVHFLQKPFDLAQLQNLIAGLASQNPR
jgi:PAS domain S-box-containing protein